MLAKDNGISVETKGTNQYLRKLSNSLLVKDIVALAKQSSKIEVFNADDSKADANSKVQTGMKVVLSNTDGSSETAYISLHGDVNGDGQISATDYIKIKNHIMKSKLIEDEAQKLSADSNYDNEITALDYIRVKRIIMDGEIVCPAVEIADFEADGKEHEIKVPTSDKYIVSGHKATEAGEYTLKLTLKEGLFWDNGTKDPIEISWTIDPHVHVKENLISICLDAVEGVKNPGEFTCSKCHETYYAEITYEDLGMPIISLEGDISSLTGDEKIKIKATYDDCNTAFTNLDATLKIQGGNSRTFDKKNYNIQLYKNGTDYGKKQKYELVDGWGKESKYTLKANYIDNTQARNIVSGKIYGEVVHSLNKDDALNDLINGGAVDGYAVAMFQNGVFHGLYTVNIPKDKWLFGMDDGEDLRQALLFMDLNTAVTRFEEHCAYGFTNSIELEHCSTEETESGTDWVVDSINAMMDFVNNNDGDDFRNGIEDYLDIDHTIDQMIYTLVLKAEDNLVNNVIWATYDGTKWFPCVYDMDGTWGQDCSGYMTSGYGLTEYTANQVWIKMYANYKEEIDARYAQLREAIITVQNVDHYFTDFQRSINNLVLNADKAKWPKIYHREENGLSHIIDYTIERLAILDEFFEAEIEDDPVYTVKFDCPSTVLVRNYVTRDYSEKMDLNNHTFARNAETGYLDNSGNGEANFIVYVPPGYRLKSLTASGVHGDIVGPSKTGQVNTYRIYNIGSNVIVSIEIESI